MCIVQRFASGVQTELVDAVEAPELIGRQACLRMKVLDLSGTCDAQTTGVKAAYRFQAAAPGEQAIPEVRNAVADRRQGAAPANYGAPPLCRLLHERSAEYNW